MSPDHTLGLIVGVALVLFVAALWVARAGGTVPVDHDDDQEGGDIAC